MTPNLSESTKYTEVDLSPGGRVHIGSVIMAHLGMGRRAEARLGLHADPSVPIDRLEVHKARKAARQAER